MAAILSIFSESQAQSPFTKIATGAIATDQGQFAIPTWADFENRGLLDLFVADYGGVSVQYRNNGDGTFTKVTQGILCLLYTSRCV